MSKNKFSLDELKKIKIAFDNLSESQDDIFESDEWDIKENKKIVNKKSIIIWSKGLDEENDEYDIAVQERIYSILDNEDDEIITGNNALVNCEDETIEIFRVSRGEEKKDLKTLSDAIDCFVEHGGKKKDLAVG